MNTIDSSQLAIDIVLFPPDQVAKELIAFSDDLNSKYGEKIHLNTVDCFPHISLLMGVATANNLEKVTEQLAEIASQTLPLEMTISGTKYSKNSTSINVVKTSELIGLQEIILERISPLLTYNPTTEMFFDEPEPLAIKWVAEFLTNSTGEAFDPHFTVGPPGQGETYMGTSSCTASTLAVCQLGNYCTCKKVLYQVPIASF
jgi:hypothetical protein